MATRKPASKFINQASADALVKFGGSQQQLAELVNQAQSTYRQSVSAAKGGAQVIQGAVDKALPLVDADFNRAEARRTTLSAAADKDIAGIGAGKVAPSILAAIGLEQLASGTRLGEARTAAKGDLTSRRVRAGEGAVYATTNAKNSLASDLQKIYGKKLSLADQIGAYKTAQAEKYAGTDFKEQVDNERLDQGQQRIDAAAAREEARRREKAAKAGEHRTKLQHGELNDKVSSAQAYAKQMKDSGISRAELARIMVTGKLPPGVLADKQLAAQVPKPSKAYGDLVSSLALDLTFGDHVSARNRNRLKKLRYSINRLGYPYKAASIPVTKPIGKGPSLTNPTPAFAPL